MDTALAFSGGKDSWACLWLHEEDLEDIHVLWVNTGKNYPETFEMIGRAKKICPNFVEIVVDRDGQNEHWGIPADVVPIDWTRQGQEMTHKKPIMIQSYLQCCYENIGANLQEYCRRHGIKTLIRGQRLDESHKSSARDGTVLDGVTYSQPIETWTKDDVMDYLSTKMDIPAHFSLNHTSMDCYDCTAYVVQSKDRIEYTRINHPELFVEYQQRMDKLNEVLDQSLER